MGSSARFDREAIYEAAIDDALFATLPQRLADLVGARSCTLHWRDSGDRREVSAHSGYFTDAQLQTYADEFTEDDLWTLEALRLPNRSWRCSDLVAEDDYRASRFYNDWIRAIGDDTYHCMGAVMSTPAGFGIVGLHRGRGQRDFADADIRRLGALAPDLRRMFAMRLRLRRVETEAAQLGAMIAGVADALLVVDRTGRILSTNPAAEALLAAGTALRSQQGRLAGEAVPALDALIAAATAPADPTGGGALLRCRSGRTMPVTAMPMPGLPGPARALLTIRAAPAGESGDAAVVALLRQSHGLSPAEAAVAVLLADGHDLAHIAELRTTGIGTVRAQIKAILWKMGLNRQGQVIARVGRLRH